MNEGPTPAVATGCRLNMIPKGKVVLITGSTDGVGRLVARRLADQGARILIHGRDRHRGKQVVDQIQRAADRALVGDPHDAERIRPGTLSSELAPTAQRRGAFHLLRY